MPGVQVVAADAAQHFRKTRFDFRAVGARDALNFAINVAFERIEPAFGLELMLVVRLEARARAIGEDHVLGDDVVNRFAVDDRAHACRIVAHHPAECGTAAG